MQTFLPHPGFATSARLLDDRRLGKQRVETFQILRALVWPSYGWKNHPAVAMWRGFVPALVSYGTAVCAEWTARGHQDSLARQLAEFTGGRVAGWAELRERGLLPPWLGRQAVHLSHRSALLRKDPGYYRPLFGEELPDDLPYVWPKPSFPRWPLRRGHHEALSLADALRLLGHEEARPAQRTALDAVLRGEDAAYQGPPGSGAATAALLAGVCTPGGTLWVSPGEPLDEEAAEAGADGPGRRSAAATPGRRGGRPPAAAPPSLARPPDAAAREAMAAEAGAEAEFRFVRPAGASPAAGRSGWSGLGLVVLDGVEEPPELPPAGRRPPVLRIHGAAPPSSREPDGTTSVGEAP
ncbi:hypothetical protein FHU37_003685 [Allostreptomyces psammosilenae]|uniref:Uncharacterized protein n=1 Tax=Allostreptomyces psammosilenae TaxID=1892865 RepID=A0A853A8I3_9ACTN|nr:MSMEG_6728 family protein [Allostreptomyces psammosilenae]NYI06742.1 hypothetical protein [Allostreptomyces psammosilenae]